RDKFLADPPPSSEKLTFTDNAALTVHITSPTNNTSINAPTNITINATANDSDGSVTNVAFFANGNSIGQDASNPYSINWSNAVIGTFALIAVATDNAGLSSTSAPVNVTFVGSGPVSLIVTGAIWKYFDQGVDLGTNWASRIYTNDASWASGPSQLGYGD